MKTIVFDGYSNVTEHNHAALNHIIMDRGHGLQYQKQNQLTLEYK